VVWEKTGKIMKAEFVAAGSRNGLDHFSGKCFKNQKK
jgi:hypothetical protein